MNCKYCGSPNQSGTSCDFCEAPLDIQRPKLREYLTLEDSEKPFRDLALFHTYDILILLRLVREERTKCYHLMRSLQKAPEDVVVDSDTLDFAEMEYRRFTGRMRVLEEILIDRMGYKPKRVDDKLLESLRRKIEKG